LTLDVRQEFLVQPVDASWLQCNIECQEACPVGTNCRGYLNLAAEGRFEEGYILSREPNPVAAMCSYVCSAPCERACRRGDIDRPLAIRAMKRFLVEWHEASGIPDVMPHIERRNETVAVVGAGPSGIAVARELAMKRMQTEAQELGAEGVVGVSLKERSHGWGSHIIEFFAIGTAIVKSDTPGEIEPPIPVLDLNDR
jgi:NADPH-dependent glutamate synthase beta subunit-like oxidoreductase